MKADAGMRQDTSNQGWNLISVVLPTPVAITLSPSGMANPRISQHELIKRCEPLAHHTVRTFYTLRISNPREKRTGVGEVPIFARKYVRWRPEIWYTHSTRSYLKILLKSTVGKHAVGDILIFTRISVTHADQTKKSI